MSTNFIIGFLFIFIIVGIILIFIYQHIRTSKIKDILFEKQRKAKEKQKLQLGDLDKQVDRVKRKIEMSDPEYLSQEVIRINQTLTKLTDSNKELTSTMQIFLDHINKLDKKTGDVETNIYSLTSMFNTTDSNYNNLIKQYNYLEQQLITNKTKYNIISEEVEELISSFKLNAKSSLNNNSEELSNEIDKLRNRLEVLERKIFNIELKSTT